MSEHMYYDEDYDPVAEGHLTKEEWSKAMSQTRKFYVSGQIDTAFRTLNSVQLREWYVNTFVLVPVNIETVKELGSNSTLKRLHDSHGWPTIEHAAIGSRLLYLMDPDSMVTGPDLLNVDSWRTVLPVAHSMMRLIRPWDYIRYEPETENWYQKVEPGQWRRLGKGTPGQSMAEGRISQWLAFMDLEENVNLYAGFPVDQAKVAQLGADAVTNMWHGSIKAFRKFRGQVNTDAQIRKILEREKLMWVDSATLDRIRTMTPFHNGMLSLVQGSYDDADGVKHTISIGELLPMDSEYMVTNANSLRWVDNGNEVVGSVERIWSNGVDTDWTWVEELEDRLLLNDCPTYWSFLTHAFPDPEERSAFLRLIGAAMFGTNLKIVAAMIGEPNAGKDTVLNWLTYLMPGQVAALPFSAFTPHGDDDRGFAPLMGARVATVSGEVGEGRGSKLLAEKIKTVSSGGGTLRVAEKYEKPTTIFFDGMLFLQGNSVPTIQGGDRALYENRLVAVEFKHPFPLQARSYEAAYRGEAAAFAKVLFLNYIRYMAKGGGMHGINPPNEWKKFAKVFAENSNAHGFIENAIVVSNKPIATQTFHAALSTMAEKFGSPYKVGPNYWPRRLRAMGFKLEGEESIRRQVSVNGERQYHYFLTLDAERSDGMFTQKHWEQVLQDVAVTS